MSKKEAPLHQHRRKEVDKNGRPIEGEEGSGRRKEERIRLCVWMKVTRIAVRQRVGDLVHPVSSASFPLVCRGRRKTMTHPSLLPRGAFYGNFLLPRNIRNMYVEKRVSYASRVTHRRGFPGRRLHESRLAMIRLWFPAILSVRCPSLLSQIRVGPRPVTAWTDVRVQIPPPCSQASRLPLANHREPALSLDNVHGERVWNIDTCAE